MVTFSHYLMRGVTSTVGATTATLLPWKLPSERVALDCFFNISGSLFISGLKEKSIHPEEEGTLNSTYTATPV